MRRIPARHLTPILREYVEGFIPKEHERGFIEDGLSMSAALVTKDVAERSGLRLATVRGLLYPGEKTARALSFDDADRLLCALGWPQRWHEWPLMVFYLGVELTEHREPVAA